MSSSNIVPTIVLRGVFESVLGGFLCIRGFAKMSDLIKCSISNDLYQREVDEEHQKKLVDFLKTEKDLFFPEVVLSYSIKEDESTGISLHEHIYGTNKIFSFRASDGTKIRINKENKTASLSTKKTTFKRIDGNHRLYAMESLGTSSDLITPFCVLLFPEVEEGKKNEMAVFHNINSKAKPLTLEEQLKGLFNIFSLEELKRFGTVYQQTKAFMDEFGNKHNVHYPNLQFAFSKKPNTVIFQSIEFLEKEKCNNWDGNITALHHCLSNINHIFESGEMKKTKNPDALITYIYYYFEFKADKNPKLAQYVEYIRKNKLYLLEHFDPASIIDLSKQIFNNRKKQIFVAMPINETYDFVLETIISVVCKINDDFAADIPKPLRIDKEVKGFSYGIVEEIWKKIDNSGLVIADLSEGNANVFYEAGFAYGLLQVKDNAAKILYLMSNKDNPEKPFVDANFDVRNLKTISYKHDGSDKGKLEEALYQELKAFYGY